MKQRFSFLSFIGVLSLCWSAAALPTALPFYRGPQSQFSSGQASRNTLEDKLVRTELEMHYEVRWDHRNFILKSNQILRDIQVAHSVRTRGAVSLLAEKKSSAREVENLSPHSKLEILEADDYWAEVRDPRNGKRAFLPLHLLEALPEDRGYFINVVDTYLRRFPRQGAPILTTVPRLNRFEVLQFKKGWLQISYQGHTGYVDPAHFISHADFARLAYHPKYKWAPIAYREGSDLVTTKGQKISQAEIWGFVPRADLAVVVGSDGEKTPPLSARVEIEKPEVHLWGVSLLEGHGEVWWKKSDLLALDTPSGKEDAITTAELMKRKLYSVAFANKKSLRGLVSAEGIYRTEDGKIWHKVPQFDDQNLPVSIHPDGIWFVGSYKSVDGGKSFEPFIRWDRLADAIESAIHRSPRILKITRVDSLAHSQVQISIDTGLQHLKLRSSLLGETWHVIR